jgi:hypothetical protein
MFHLSMHLPSKVFKFISNLKNEELKSTDVLDKAKPSRNLGTNPKELHTPKLTPKKPKRDNGDMKKKLELDRVLYKNEAW